MLTISEDLELDDQIVTETIAMLAKRGGGKSNAAVLLAEQMTDAGYQWVAIDPKGDWWGIRSSADGKHPGLPIPVFGGLHGDIPLEATAGTLMATLVIDRGLTCVLDVSEFSKTEQIRFVTDFAETLFRLIRKAPRAMHLFLEEAEEFLPQRVEARAARMVGAYSKISKQGRTFGLGVTLITQRSASLNKDALSQTDTLVVFRTPSPHDRKAVAGWLEHHDEAGDVAGSLSELQPGESWIISPGFLGQIVRVKWNRRRTFDSGATPVAGVTRSAAPVSLADIDLDEVAGLMADTIERATADDPKALHAEIARLTKQLAERPTPDPVVDVIEIPMLDPELVAHIQEASDQVATACGDAVQAYTALQQDLANALDALPITSPNARAWPPKRTDPPRARQPVSIPAAPARPERTPTPSGSATGWPEGVGKAGRKILTVLAQHGTISRRRLALQAEYSASGGGFGNALSALRTAGYITGSDPISLTAAGAAIIPTDLPALPSGDHLIAYWINKVGKESAAGKILVALTTAWPDSIDKVELAHQTDYEPTGGGFGNALSKLRTLDLIVGNRSEPLRASDDLMQGAGL